MYIQKTSADVNENVKPLLAQGEEQENRKENGSLNRSDTSGRPYEVQLTLPAAQDQHCDSAAPSHSPGPVRQARGRRDANGTADQRHQQEDSAVTASDKDEHWRWSWTPRDPRSVQQVPRWASATETNI